MIMTSPNEPEESTWVNPLQTPQSIQLGKMIDLAERMWVEKRRFPTTKEFRDELGGDTITNERVRRLVDHPNFEWLLEQRGLSNGIEGDLMPEQIAAIQLFFNMQDGRPWGQKLADIGVKAIQWNGWMRNKKFKDIVQAEAERIFGDGIPMAHASLMRAVAKGDIRALKLYYDKFGFGADMAAGSQQDVKSVLMSAVEIIQRHVTDPATLKLIARDFEILVNSMNTQQVMQMGSRVPTPASVRGEIE